MEYLINKTTKDERKEIVKDAFGISVASNEMPTNETIELAKQYINGEIELDEAQNKVIERYRK